MPNVPAGIEFPRVIAVAPEFVAVTGTEIVQLVDPEPAGAAAMDPPLSCTEFVAGVAVSVPPHVLPVGPAAITIVPGSVSVSETTPLSAVALKLAMVMVSVAVPPEMMVVGENALVTLEPVCTTRLPEMALFAMPLPVVTEPAASVLVRVALTNALGLDVTTDAVTMHEPFAAIEPPDSCTDVPPATPVTAPPQVVARLVGLASNTLAGKLSVKPTLVIGTPLVFDSTIDIVDPVPPPCATFGANALVPVRFTSEVATSVACAACVFVSCDDDTAPAGIVLMYVPGVFDSTPTVN